MVQTMNDTAANTLIAAWFGDHLETTTLFELTC